MTHSSTCSFNSRIRTGSGRLVDPFNITPDDIEPYFMLRALCHINRFTGHGQWPYSVGQHTLVLSHEVPVHLRRAAIIHDWVEVWFNDMASPVKHHPTMQEYRKKEKIAAVKIALVMGVSQDELSEFDEYDKRIYIDERDVMHKRIDEQGYGDDRKALGVNPFAFRERPWRVVFTNLRRQYAQYFPERPLIGADT